MVDKPNEQTKFIDKTSSAEGEGCWSSYSNLRNQIAGELINNQHCSQDLSIAHLELAKYLCPNVNLIATVSVRWTSIIDGSTYYDAILAFPWEGGEPILLVATKDESLESKYDVVRYS